MIAAVRLAVGGEVRYSEGERLSKNGVDEPHSDDDLPYEYRFWLGNGDQLDARGATSVEWTAWFSLAVVATALGLLILTRLAADLVLIGAVVALLLSGVLASEEALAGLSNEGMVTVAALFIVAAGVSETGGVTVLSERMLGRPRSITRALLRMMLPTSVMSAFINNTPIVAMFIPAVNDWAKKCQLPVSKLMIPLSYAAILGGTCTLIGTSTNLVVNGMVISVYDSQIAAGGQPVLPRGLSMFDIAWVGLPAASAGTIFILFAQRWLLPDRKPALSKMQDPREYTIEMLVPPDSPLIGKSIEVAGLRHLPGAYLAEIDREGYLLPAVSPEERLRAHDRLVFVGIVDTMVDLQKMRGLIPATDQVFKLDSPRSSRCLIQAVVSNSCPLANKSIRDGQFRTRYNAVVIAVAREGERIQKKLGDIVLEPGDNLLLEAHPSFVEQQRNNRDFFLVSPLENSNPPRHERTFVALGILLAMVVTISICETFRSTTLQLGDFSFRLGSITVLKAALVAAGLMIVTRCIRTSQARRSLDWQTLLAIAAALAIGRAVEKSGAAHEIAVALIRLADGNPWLSLAAIYLVTSLVTETITNNAAAALMFPFALATANSLGVNPMPFIIVVMMAPSASFATPIGYQTNLMVYGPGGYRFNDFLKIGLPLNLLLGLVTVLLAPLIWPFDS